MLSALNMFVINLDHTPERMREFQQINAHLPNVTRFPAIDGKSVGHKALIERGIFAPPIFYKDGSVGNTLSHRELWMMAAERGEIVTAFEDDAIIHSDFETLAPAMIAKLRPDWDMVVWGWNFDAALSFDLFPSVPCLAHFSQTDMRNQWEAIQKDAIQPSLHRHHYGFGTIAYSVSPAGAKKSPRWRSRSGRSFMNFPGTISRSRTLRSIAYCQRFSTASTSMCASLRLF